LFLIKIGEAVVYASNQWSTLVRYLEDVRLTIDNSPAEQAIRPLAVGRRNWLQIAGDGGLPSAAVLLSIAASAKRHAVNAWVYVKHLLTECVARPKAMCGPRPLGRGRPVPGVEVSLLLVTGPIFKMRRARNSATLRRPRLSYLSRLARANSRPLHVSLRRPLGRSGPSRTCAMPLVGDCAMHNPVRHIEGNLPVVVARSGRIDVGSTSVT